MNKDYSASAEFLRNFFGPTTEHNVEIRSLPQEHGGGPNRPRFTRDAEIACEHLVKWDLPGRASYFGACTRVTGKASGSRADCAEMPGVWVDIDCEKQSFSKADAVSAALSLPMRPSLLIDSGGGIHGYWLLNEAMPVLQGPLCDDESIIAVLRQLAGVLAGDPAVCDIARVMRLPGTSNFKYGEPRLCSLLEVSDFSIRYEFSDLVEMLDVQRPVLRSAATTLATIPDADNDPWLAVAKELAIWTPVDVQQRLRDMRYEGIGETAIHPTRCSVSSSLVAQGVEDDTIFEILLHATERAAGVVGSNWNWKREEKIIREEIRTARVKYARPPKATVTNVVPLRGAAQAVAKIEEKDSPEEERDLAPRLAGYPLNDLGNAARLIASHGASLRYVVGIGWHAWDGRRYEFDPATVAARKLAHKTVRSMLLQAFDTKALTKEKAKARETVIKFAVGSGNTNKISGMLAQAEPHLACEADSLNSNQWLLNCLNGTLDLLSGDFRPHSQADLLTKLVPVEYDAGATCPIWEAFLLSIFGGSVEMVEFLRRALGYSLSGSTREQVIFILHGSGANGKSVLLDTIATLLNDYAAHCPTDTFTSNDRGSGIPNDVARLAGSRFVSIVETEHDKKLAEGLVKQATGGDRLTARFMRQEFFEFTPRFKIWLATNHKPRIRGTDNAIWRRILELPFNVTFVDKDVAKEGQPVKDLDLKEKLLVELPGILSWAVRGFIAWSSVGLLPPVAVKEATKEYRDSQDIVASFIEERCNIDVGIECASGDLYNAYKKWCDENGERTISSGEFNSSLSEKGYFPRKGAQGRRIRRGLDLRHVYDAVAE